MLNTLYAIARPSVSPSVRLSTDGSYNHTRRIIQQEAKLSLG